MVVRSSVALLVAGGSVDQVLYRSRGPRRKAEQPGRGERAGRVDENHDLTAAVPAVERVGHISGTAAGVAPARAARLRLTLQAEAVRVSGPELRGRDRRLHQPQKIGAKEASAEQRAIEAGDVVGVRDERAGGPLDRRAADRHVLERTEEVPMRVALRDARLRREARRPQAQRREDPAFKLP